MTWRYTPVHRVAVDVHPGEEVVGADLLDLLEGLHQRPLVPDADVADGQGVGGDVGGSELVRSGEGLLLDPVEAVGAPRRFEVVADVGSFARQLVGLDHEALDQRRRDDSQEDGGDHQGDRGEQGPAALPGPGPGEKHRSGGQVHQDEQPVDPYLDIGVDVAGPERHPVVGIQQTVDLEPVDPGDDEKEQARQDRQVRRGPRQRGDPLLKADAAAGNVDDADGGEGKDDAAEQVPGQEAQERKFEDVEADVPRENRVGEAEGLIVEEAQPQQPLARTDPPHQQHQHRAGRQVSGAGAQQRVEGSSLGAPGRTRRTQQLAGEAPRHGEIGCDHQRRHQAEENAGEQARAHRPPVDGLEVQAVEPLPVGVHRGQHEGSDSHAQQCCGQRQAALFARHDSPRLSERGKRVWKGRTDIGGQAVAPVRSPERISSPCSR